MLRIKYRKDMAEIFDPVVNPIIELVAKQIRGASDTDNRVSVRINFQPFPPEHDTYDGE